MVKKRNEGGCTDLSPLSSWSIRLLTGSVPTIIATSVLCALLLFVPSTPHASVYNFLRMTAPGSIYAVDPDLIIRRMNPAADKNTWTKGHSWGFPPILNHVEVPGLFQRTDFLYPLGRREESAFQSAVRFAPFFGGRWSKVPPYDYHNRVLTFYEGRSDMGQEYYGFFPFYGFLYRRLGVDFARFFMFPLYFQSFEDDIVTHRFLWPFITYADSPGRKSIKVWPIFGKDDIQDRYTQRFVFWPFFQTIVKRKGTRQQYVYSATPLPIYVKEQTPIYSNTYVMWPFISWYHHYPTGFKRFRIWPFYSSGSGGGVEETNFLYIYTSKKDRRGGICLDKGGSGYLDITGDEIFTEKTFFFMSAIQKVYRKSTLVFARYRFWPIAEYTWDIEKGTHVKFPLFIPLKNDWWDLNLGRVLSLIDFRDTPITREISGLFGFSKGTEVKRFPTIPKGPKPGDDNFTELILGSFGNREQSF